MKKHLAIAFVVFLVVFAVAGANAQGKFSLNVGGNALLPIGTWSDVNGFGFGGDVLGEYNVSPMAVVFLRTGFYIWPGKTVSGFDFPNYKGIPILVGGRYYFMPEGKARFYGQAELGLFIGMVTIKTHFLGVDTESSTTDTNFSFAPVVGVELPAGKGAVDISARYFLIATTGATSGSLGARVGYKFMLN